MRPPATFVLLAVVVVVVSSTNASRNLKADDYLILSAKLAAPPNKTSTGQGKAAVLLPYRGKGEAKVFVNLTGALDEITMAHIHLYMPAAGNPVIVDLLPRLNAPIVTKLDPPVSYKGTFSFVSVFNETKLPMWMPGATFQQFFSWLNSSMLYVNVHTVAAPGGAIQGFLACERKDCNYY